MSSGTLEICGMFVLEWFLNTFQTILDAYDAPVTKHKPEVAIYRQYTENWKKMLDEDKQKEGKIPFCIPQVSQ